MTDWTYNGADINDLYYGPDRWCHMSIWFSPSAAASAPVMLSYPGGGWQPTTFQLDAKDNRDNVILNDSTVQQAAIDNGIHVARVMYPHGGANAALQVHPARPFPRNGILGARAICFLKDNAALYGFDKTRMIAEGISSGAQLVLLAQLMALDIGLAPYHSPHAITNEFWTYLSNCRVRDVISRGAPLDFTVIDPTTGGVAAKSLFYAGTRHPNFKSLPDDLLRAASPYWWAQRNPTELANLSVFSNWPGNASVDPDAWTWGTEFPGFSGVDDPAYGKQWQAWHEGNALLANSHWETHWGSAGGAHPNTAGNYGLAGSALANAVVDHWGAIGILP